MRGGEELGYSEQYIRTEELDVQIAQEAHVIGILIIAAFYVNV